MTAKESSDLRRKMTDRLLGNRKIEDGCWVWQKSCNASGYGQTSFLPLARVTLVSRVAAWLWLGMEWGSPICALHRCDNPPCFNPDHLFLGTKADNMADMDAKGRRKSVPVYGEESTQHILCERDVLTIRRIVDAEGHRRGTRAELARRFGVSWHLIDNVAKRRDWAHIP